MPDPFQLGELGRAMPSLQASSSRNNNRRPRVPPSHPPSQPVTRAPAPTRQRAPQGGRAPLPERPWSFAGSTGFFQPYWGIHFKLPATDVGERNVELAFKRSIEAVFKRKMPHSVQIFRTKNGKIRGDGSLLFGQPDVHVVYLEYLERYPHSRPSIANISKAIVCSAERRAPDGARLAMLIQRLVPSDDENSDTEQTTIDCLSGRTLSCGTWDAAGNFCEGWRKSVPVTVSLEQRDAQVKIASDFFEIRCSLYGCFMNIETDGKWLYLNLEKRPIIYEAHPEEETMLRTWGIDAEHDRVAPYCYVYRVECSRADMINYCSQKQVEHRLQTLYHMQQQDQDQLLNVDRDLQAIEQRCARLPYAVAFQVHLLLANGHLLPHEVAALAQALPKIVQRVGEAETVNRLRSFPGTFGWRSSAANLQRPDVVNTTIEEVFTMLRQSGPVSSAASPSKASRRARERADGMVPVHRLLISPTGIQLSGPEPDDANRIIRRFGPEHYDAFLRVHLVEEDGGRLNWQQGTDASALWNQRFRNFLLGGIVVAGRRFAFLGFSSSALREHSAWLCLEKIVVDGLVHTPDSIREDIGDLSAIRCAALYAARLGQAFTSTSLSITLPARVFATMTDIHAPIGPDGARYDFSDGHGTLSQEVVNRINAKMHRQVEGRGTVNVFQIRAGGAKGVLSLDTRLRGVSVRLRTSMEKFKLRDHTRDDWTLEVVTQVTRPHTQYLNRPLIAALETLGVKSQSFMHLQSLALKEARAAVTSVSAAMALPNSEGWAQALKAKRILQYLKHELDIEGLTEVPFLRECNMAVLTHALRQIKYRARIPVADAWTVMGILDETATLKEGEIYVCIQQPQGKRRAVKGKCLVTRSPTMYPGDIQFATAIGDVPESSPLHPLVNIVAFSQKGARPLPSCLGGGDLDGDLYNIIQDASLFPPVVDLPAVHAPPRRKMLARNCNVADVIEFMLEYCQNDVTGMLSSLHLATSDSKLSGIRDPDCLHLADLVTAAVDFPKTGIAPDKAQVPRLPSRPDYMRPEHHIEGKPRKAGRKAADRNTYHKSDKTLGKLFRTIDVNGDLSKWLSKAKEELSSKAVLARIWEHIEWRANVCRYKAEREAQQHAVNEYYERLDRICYDNSSRSDTLSEAEAVTGVIINLGNRPRGVAKDFDAAAALRTSYGEAVSGAMRSILGIGAAPDEDSDDEEELAFDAFKFVAETASRQERRHAHSFFSEQFARAAAFFRAAREVEAEAEHSTDGKERRSAPWVVAALLFRLHTVLHELDVTMIQGYY